MSIQVICYLDMIKIIYLHHPITSQKKLFFQEIKFDKLIQYNIID